MPKFTSNKYIRLLISAIFVGIGIYTIRNFALEILFIGIAIIVVFLKFKNPSPNSFLNNCPPFPFNDQTMDHSSIDIYDRNMDISTSYFDYTNSIYNPTVDCGFYTSPIYRHIPGNVFYH